MKCLPGTADTAFPVEQLKAVTNPKIGREMVQHERMEKYMPPQHPSRAPMEAIPTPPMGRIYWPREIRGSDDHVAPIWVREAVAPTPTPASPEVVAPSLPKYPLQIRDDPAPAPDAMRANVPEVDPTAANLADMMKKLQDGVDRCEAGQPLDNEDCNPDKMPVTQDSLDLAKGLALAEQSAQIMDLEDNLEKDGKAPPRKAPEKTKLEDLLDGDCSDASEFCGGRMVGPS